MPQPLSYFGPQGVVSTGDYKASPFRDRPTLAISAIEAISAWSNAENYMLDMYVALAGGDEADAAAVYLSLETQNAKSSAITALSRRRLNDREQRILQAILRIAKSRQKERDKVAHWTWGTSSSLPNAMLLVDPRARDVSSDNIYVYDEKEFAGMRKRFDRISDFSLRFAVMLYRPSDRATICDQLSQEPEIAEILDRQARLG